METILNKQREYFRSGATLPIKNRLDALKKLKSVIELREKDILYALKSDLGKSET